MSETRDRELTILFSDVEGSTELRSRKGDEAADEILQIHETIVRDELERHGTLEVVFLGDGFMATFPSPVDGVRAAIAIERALEEHNRADPERHVRVRIGLHAGGVTQRDGKLYGRAVHGASRVSSEAAGGQILVSDVVNDAWTDGETRDLGLFWLKGFPERWRLYEVEWRTDTGAPAGPAVPAGHAPMVERETERAELRRAVDDARSGRGSLLLIGGEAGIGKSRMVSEIAAEAEQRGMLALVGHSIDVERPTPYLPFVEILEQALLGPRAPEWLRDAAGDAAPELSRIIPALRRAFADLTAPVDLPPEQAGRYLWLSVQEFLDRAASVRPLLLVLEDLHWADESTLSLIEFLTPALEHMPVLVVGTYRSVEVSASHPLARLMTGLARRGLVRRVRLNRLTSEGVAEMIRGLSHEEPPQALVEAIYSESDGNPFFVEEVFLHLSESGKLTDERGRFRTDLTVSEVDVPESVRVLLGRRLERLTAETREILTAGAAISRGFAVNMLLELTGASREAVGSALDEAERARLIEPDGARFRFVHELIRQTLLSETSTLRRQELHLRAADAIERLHADDLEEQASRLAYHLTHAGPEAEPARLGRYLRIAGERALRAAAFGDAVSQFENALAAVADDANLRAELNEDLAIALRSVGRWDEALQAMDRALTGYEELQRMEDFGRFCWAMVYQLAWAARWEEAVALAQRGLAGLGEALNPDRARLLAAAGWVVGGTGDYETSSQMFAGARQIADALGDDRVLADVLHLQTINHMGFAEFDRGIEAGLLAIDVFEAENALWDLCSALSFTLYQTGAIGRVHDAAELAARAEPLAERLGHLGVKFLILADRARTTALRGDLDGVHTCAQEMVEVCERGGLPWTYVGHMYLGLAAQWRGDWDTAARELVIASDLDAPGPFGGQVKAILANFRALEGREEDVRELFEEMRPTFARGGVVNTLGSWNLLLGFLEPLWLVGRNEDAAELLPLAEQALELQAEWISFDSRWVRTRVAIAAAAAERYDEAEALFSEVLRRGEELPNPMERADVH
ncbi:MAG: ATP-binding protein, partial [Actinomycetota bacterium]